MPYNGRRDVDLRSVHEPVPSSHETTATRGSAITDHRRIRLAACRRLIYSRCTCPYIHIEGSHSIMAHRVCQALSFALVYRTEGVDGSCIPRGSKQPRTLSLAGRRRPNSGEERFRSGKFRATTNCRATHPTARATVLVGALFRSEPGGAGPRRPNPGLRLSWVHPCPGPAPPAL